MGLALAVLRRDGADYCKIEVFDSTNGCTAIYVSPSAFSCRGLASGGIELYKNTADKYNVFLWTTDGKLTARYDILTSDNVVTRLLDAPIFDLALYAFDAADTVYL